ncbi:MAG: hypothetical protein K2G33_12005 [Duncaniella sp.]|nr:hypothetical protein [Duncaniella sp.]
MIGLEAGYKLRLIPSGVISAITTPGKYDNIFSRIPALFNTSGSRLLSAMSGIVETGII